MFILENERGAHLISGSESLHKAMGLPSSQRAVIMVDESGQFVSAGRTASDLERNGELVKSLRAGEALAKAQKNDDKLIQANRKLKTDKVQNRLKAGEVGRHDRLDGSKIVKASVVKHTKSDVHPLFDRYEEVPAEDDDLDDGYARYDNSPMAKSFRRNSLLDLLGEFEDLKAHTEAYGY